MGLSLEQESTEQAEAMNDVLEIAVPVGIRKGNDLFEKYLPLSIQSFLSSIEQAATLLSSIKDISLPGEMCPLNGAD